MLLVLLIAGLWSAGLLLVAGLCAAARRGDRTAAPELAPHEQGVAAVPPHAHEPVSPAVRLAA